MPLGRAGQNVPPTSERLAPRFRLAKGGVRFGKQYSVGQQKFPFGVKTAHALKIRSFKPEAHAERLRGVGNSSGDENGSNSMKYWEIVADNLSKAGWSWGYCSAVTHEDWRWIVDAHREGRRYIVQSDELLTAFLEVEATVL